MTGTVLLGIFNLESEGSVHSATLDDVTLHYGTHHAEIDGGGSGEIHAFLEDGGSKFSVHL